MFGGGISFLLLLVQFCHHKSASFSSELEDINKEPRIAKKITEARNALCEHGEHFSLVTDGQVEAECSKTLYSLELIQETTKDIKSFWTEEKSHELEHSWTHSLFLVSRIMYFWSGTSAEDRPDVLLNVRRLLQEQLFDLIELNRSLIKHRQYGFELPFSDLSARLLANLDSPKFQLHSLTDLGMHYLGLQSQIFSQVVSLQVNLSSMLSVIYGQCAPHLASAVNIIAQFDLLEDLLWDYVHLCEIYQLDVMDADFLDDCLIPEVVLTLHMVQQRGERQEHESVQHELLPVASQLFDRLDKFAFLYEQLYFQTSNDHHTSLKQRLEEQQHFMQNYAIRQIESIKWLLQELNIPRFGNLIHLMTLQLLRPTKAVNVALIAWEIDEAILFVSSTLPLLQHFSVSIRNGLIKANDELQLYTALKALLRILKVQYVEMYARLSEHIDEVTRGLTQRLPSTLDLQAAITIITDCITTLESCSSGVSDRERNAAVATSLLQDHLHDSPELQSIRSLLHHFDQSLLSPDGRMYGELLTRIHLWRDITRNGDIDSLLNIILASSDLKPIIELYGSKLALLMSSYCAKLAALLRYAEAAFIASESHVDRAETKSLQRLLVILYDSIEQRLERLVGQFDKLRHVSGFQAEHQVKR